METAKSREMGKGVEEPMKRRREERRTVRDTRKGGRDGSGRFRVNEIVWSVEGVGLDIVGWLEEANYLPVEKLAPVASCLLATTLPQLAPA